jgi:hypothetical protein
VKKNWNDFLGKTRDEIVGVLGEPDAKGAISRKYREPQIYKYGDIEFHFYSGTCWMVFDEAKHETLCKR